MVMFYFNEGKKISRLETKYSNKTKIREIIFDAYFDGNLDMESVITRLNVSRRQFFRLKQKYIDKKINIPRGRAAGYV
jgi:AraC-like DNA-binding protein